MINVIDSNNDFDELVETYEISEDEDYYSAENVIVKALKYQSVEECEIFMEVLKNNDEYVLEYQNDMVLTEAGLQYLLFHDKKEETIKYLQDYLNNCFDDLEEEIQELEQKIEKLKRKKK